MPASAQLGQQDLIGRRLFDSSLEAKSFDFVYFVDTRLDSNLSVDVLGVGNPEKKRLKALTILADAEGDARYPAVRFDGWAAILVKDLKFPGWVSNIFAVPVAASEGKSPNEFHAEISRQGFGEKAQSYAFATMMADRFSRKGRYVAPVR